MVGSHALQMSSRNTTENEEQTVPLAIRSDRKTSQIPLRQSLIGVANSWSRTTSDNVCVNAIAQLGEDRRRASIAIRRQSIIQTQQDAAASHIPLQQHKDHRASIRAYRPSNGRQSVKIWEMDPSDSNSRTHSVAYDGESSSGERRASTAARRASIAERRRSSIVPARTHRRSSVIEAVTTSTAQAVRRASLAM